MDLVGGVARHLERSLAIPFTIVLLSGVLLITFVFRLLGKNEPQPPYLWEAIPFVSNTYQYLTDMGAFLDRATEALGQNGIIRFKLGLRDVYMVSGAKNVAGLFRPPHITDPNMFHTLLMDKHWDMSKDEIKMFEDDKSGRKRVPNPGTEDTPPSQRHWYNHHQIYAKYLSSARYTEVLANTFYRFLAERLDESQPLHQYATVDLYDFMKVAMAESAVKSMFGTKILELNPDLLKCYWEFDEVAGILVWGLPRFLIPRAYEIRDRLHGMTTKQTAIAYEEFDWDGPEAESDWDPYWGSRFAREIALWLKESGFSVRTASGHTMATLFGLNGNTLPIATWILMELIQDPPLLRRVRQEAQQAFAVDELTGQRRLADVEKLLSMPLIQSVYSEALRMHISFNATREALEDIWIGGYRIAKGSLIQTPTQIAHYEDAVWNADGHPAAEFWAERHLDYTAKTGEDTKPGEARFSINARPTSYFPYGGDHAMCPGRHFAKREIIMAVAIIVVKFDIEFVQWLHYDGSASDRPARNDKKYAGAAGMPPDREMKIRWKRLW
ncbi:cytochrome P450 [Durotheca rogersii]|uniref:cytochrome P450 n=1 Tax=Durotheca rogersii TaxID=419775 RepID=UPI00221EBC63|nr:cytochrome P450 [Durotheca rogersii]KAI5862347.1 cytochrome P450 [Durotheca rogersii]